MQMQEEGAVGQPVEDANKGERPARVCAVRVCVYVHVCMCVCGLCVVNTEFDLICN
jgi:hypothetical protein